MAIIIHIQEVNSTQVSEVIAETVERALWAYAHNAAARWAAFTEATAHYYPNNVDIERMVFTFDGEQLTLCHVYGERFSAEWI